MALTSTSTELTLGPLYFNWSAGRLADFYARIADEAPVERVHLGEVVCGKRSPLTIDAVVAAAERLERGGKTVVWSGLISPVNKRERRMTRDLMQGDGLVEINDFGALKDRQDRPFVAGPYLNVYNEAALALLASMGCRRWCPRVELSLDAISAIAAGNPGVEVELFAFGRLPLAHSGRCYHARQNGLTKDSCQYVCEKDPDGAGIETLDGIPFLAYNGVQTLSHALHVSPFSSAALQQSGVSALRLSPHTGDMVTIARAWRGFLDGRYDRDALLAAIRGEMPGFDLVSGYLAGKPGREWNGISQPAT